MATCSLFATAATPSRTRLPRCSSSKSLEVDLRFSFLNISFIAVQYEAVSRRLELLAKIQIRKSAKSRLLHKERRRSGLTFRTYSICVHKFHPTFDKFTRFG